MTKDQYFKWRNKIVIKMVPCNNYGTVYVHEADTSKLHIVKATSLKKLTKAELALYLIGQKGGSK